MKQAVKRTGAAAAASVLLAFICGLAVYQTMGFVYAIADDVIMRDIASGAFTGTPDGHLFFVQYALGRTISSLYRINGRADWYGFFMAGAVFLSLAAILYRGLAAKKSWKWKGVYCVGAVGVTLTALLSHAAQFEWTISAAALGAAALFLYVSAGRRKTGLADGVWIWMLLILTYGIRSDVFFMVLPGFGLAFLWKAFQKNENGNKWKINFRELLLPVLVFFAVGLLFLVEKKAYSGPEWAEFQRFQNARSEVYDYYGVPAYEADPEFFDGLGISSEEVRALRHYALYLVDGMDAQMMEKLSVEARRQTDGEPGTMAKIKAAVKLAAEQFFSPEYRNVSLSVAVFFLLAVILLWKREKRLYPLLLLYLCAHGLLWLALGYAGRLPERVAFSLHLVMLGGFGGLFTTFCEKEEDRCPWLRPVAGILCILSVLTVLLQWQSSTVSNREKLALDSSFQTFKNACKEETEKLYFIETYMAEPVGGARVVTNGNFALNRCLTFGDWYTDSPLDQERFMALGVKSVEQTLFTDENAYLVARDVEDPGFLASWLAWKKPGAELTLTENREIDGRMYYFYQIQE